MKTMSSTPPSGSMPRSCSLLDLGGHHQPPREPKATGGGLKRSASYRFGELCAFDPALITALPLQRSGLSGALDDIDVSSFMAADDDGSETDVESPVIIKRQRIALSPCDRGHCPSLVRTGELHSR